MLTDVNCWTVKRMERWKPPMVRMILRCYCAIVTTVCLSQVRRNGCRWNRLSHSVPSSWWNGISYTSHLNIHAVSALTPSFFIFLHFRAHKSVQSIISPLPVNRATPHHLTSSIAATTLSSSCFLLLTLKKELLYCVIFHGLKYSLTRQKLCSASSSTLLIFAINFSLKIHNFVSFSWNYYIIHLLVLF